ncbi:MAG: hypothetical protein JW958_05580 [Candidatus Eisenbacteria bacterium]|nr:hypothetical protein [Candidatus Eisenbacteria bacterium]
MRAVSILFMVCFFLVAAVRPSSSAPTTGEEGEGEVLFGEAIILRKPVFNPSVPGYDRFPFSWLNRLHVVTRENVIRNALLFREGDPYDEEILRETERNLRGLMFINYASVEPLDPDEKRRRVVVETHDTWSTQVELSVDDEEEGGEKDDFEIRLNEINILGFGKRIGLRYTRRGNRGGLGYVYEDPLLFGSRWNMKVEVQGGPGDDRSHDAYLRRPFYSLRTRWGGVARTIRVESVRDLYRADRRIGDLFRVYRWESVAVGRMLGDRRRKFLFRFEGTREEKVYRDLRLLEGVDSDTVAAPENERRWIGGVGLGYGSFHFIEEHQIDHFDRVEDVELGGYLYLSAGRVVEGEGEWRFAGQGQYTHPTGSGRYLAWIAGTRADRLSGGWGRTLAYGSILSHQRWSRRNTLAARIRWDELWRADPGEQFLLDHLNGLRGFGSASGAGVRRLVINVENRFFSSIRFYTLAFGAAFFFDAGATWDRRDAVRAEDIRSSFGAGLRVGLTKSRNSNVFRVDVAKNLEDGSLSAHVGLGQIFSLASPFTDFTNDPSP